MYAEHTQQQQNMPNYIGGIDTKCKTAFTREYNASGHTSQALVEPLAAVKKGKVSIEITVYSTALY
jgi:hypothetical protein